MPPGDRKTREPHVRWFGECSVARSHSSGDSTLVLRRNGSDLDGTDRRRRTACRPIQRRVKRGKFQNCESPQLLFGLGEGAILHVPPSVFKSHRGPGLRRLKWIATDIHAGFYERLVVRPPGTKVRIVFVAIPCRKCFW